MVSDPIGDMLARIKNAYLAGHQEVKMPYSKLKEKMGKILTQEGYLKSQKNQKNKIICQLKYEGDKPAMRDFKRVSKPGRRIYARADKIPFTLGGYGLTLISTSQGLMTDKEARKKKLGGEVIGQVW